MSPVVLAALAAARHDDLERLAGCCTANAQHVSALKYASRRPRWSRGLLAALLALWS